MLSGNYFYSGLFFSADLVDIAVGGGPHVIAVTSDGTMFGWGYNGYGHAGLNHSNSQVLAPAPIQLNLAGDRITKVSCGGSHCLALSQAGQVQ